MKVAFSCAYIYMLQKLYFIIKVIIKKLKMRCLFFFLKVLLKVASASGLRSLQLERKDETS